MNWYRYDGLGRLIQKLTPLTKGSTAYQCKDFYYDGVRRITETIFRPELSFVMIDPSFVEEDPNGLEYVEVEKEQNDEAAKLAPEENEELTPGGGGGVEEPIELIEMGHRGHSRHRRGWLRPDWGRSPYRRGSSRHGRGVPRCRRGLFPHVWGSTRHRWRQEGIFSGAHRTLAG